MLLSHARRQYTLLTHGISAVALLALLGHALSGLHSGHIDVLISSEPPCSVFFAPSPMAAQDTWVSVCATRLHRSDVAFIRVRARREWRVEMPRAICFLAGPVKPSAQSAARVVMAGARWWMQSAGARGVFAGAAGGRGGGVSAQARVVNGLTAASGKYFAMADAMLTRW